MHSESDSLWFFHKSSKAAFFPLFLFPTVGTFDTGTKGNSGTPSWKPLIGPGFWSGLVPNGFVCFEKRMQPPNCKCNYLCRSTRKQAVPNVWLQLRFFPETTPTHPPFWKDFLGLWHPRWVLVYVHFTVVARLSCQQHCKCLERIMECFSRNLKILSALQEATNILGSGRTAAIGNSGEIIMSTIWSRCNGEDIYCKLLYWM